MTSSAPAGGMSYTVKLGCQAYLGFVSKSWPHWIPEEKESEDFNKVLGRSLEISHMKLFIFYLFLSI